MAKKIDTAGMWTIKSNPITHSGVAMYSGRAIDATGSLGLEPLKLYPVYRPIEELVKACESFNGKPLINNHEMIGTAEGLTKPDEKNVGGTIFNVRQADGIGDTIVADMTIFSDEIQKNVQDGKCELSLGYYCKYRPEVGTHNGQRYDFVQYDLEGNHIALVDCGRMGSGVRVFDSKTMVFDSMEINMEKKAKTLDADELRDEVSALLKDASDEALAKCKDVLAPAKDDEFPKKDDEQDEDEDKSKKPEASEGEDPEKKDVEDDEDPAKKQDDCGEGAEKSKDEGEEKNEEEKKGEPAKAGDSAPSMKEMLKEIAHRERLYKALVPHVGSFDHDEMTCREVAKYAASKLVGCACVDGAEVACVENFITGICKSVQTKKSFAGDSVDAGASNVPSAKLKQFLGE